MAVVSIAVAGTSLFTRRVTVGRLDMQFVNSLRNSLTVQRRATFRSSSDCFHADTNKRYSFDISIYPRAWVNQRHLVYARKGSLPRGIYTT